MTRKCKGCGGDIPPTLRSGARFCSGACRSRSHYAANRAAYLERVRAYASVNRDQICAAAKARRLRNIESVRVKENAYNTSHRVQRGRAQRLRYHLLTYGHTQYAEDPMKNPHDRYARARAEGYRSGLEVRIANQLKAAGVAFEYEPFRIPFTQPSKPRHYTPDVSLPNGIVIESKGRFLTADRAKHKLIQAQHPDLQIRFVFSNPNTRISKQSKTTYAMWADSHGFKYAQGDIPPAWIAEPPHRASLAAIARLRKDDK